MFYGPDAKQRLQKLKDFRFQIIFLQNYCLGFLSGSQTTALYERKTFQQKRCRILSLSRNFDNPEQPK